MIVGEPSRFAIESEITTAYERPSFLALGYFVIYIKGSRYGVFNRDATLLACSFEQVEQRIKDRSSHTAEFVSKLSAGVIADAFRVALYGAASPVDTLQQVVEEFSSSNTSNLLWAPDGDAAFDDGSFILQFDVNDRVRLIAFRCQQDGLHDPASTTEVWISADEFYSVLQKWHRDFYAEWTKLPKVGSSGIR